MSYCSVHVLQQLGEGGSCCLCFRADSAQRPSGSLLNVGIRVPKHFCQKRDRGVASGSIPLSQCLGNMQSVPTGTVSKQFDETGDSGLRLGTNFS